MIYLINKVTKNIILRNESRIYVQAMKHSYDTWCPTFVLTTYEGEGIKEQAGANEEDNKRTV